jgi:sulfide:quinone oxidoreductase
VEVTFRTGERPVGRFDDASELDRADKSTFGSTRIRRWFGREGTAS